MSREPRRIEPNAVYHLISRFVDREWYITGEDERHFYLQLLGRALVQSDWRCLAYAVMSNHIHLAIVAGTHSLASWLRRVHSPFVNVMNRSYDRSGPMFQRGPKSILVEPDGVARVIAYIHNNPVRAGCVGAPSESSWTSHRMYIEQTRPSPWLHLTEGLARAGFSDASDFDRWVADPDREEFEAAYEELIEEAPSRTRDEPRACVDPAVIVAAVARELGMSLEQLTSRRRTSKEVLAREVVVHCSESLGLRGVDVASVLCVTQQAVSLIRNRGITFDARMIGTRVLGQVVATRAA
ncbi:MAG: transposase [Myxococcota bacterium]|nr:transposase [Myxococcota bacterium]